ncbi:hypothetical protein BJAS_P3145 [Bathymodiolus japonicus methanotrophic gill symbiont]|uniref:heme-binding beta-barrel domain-containing protein n=1 Tax=Bathymodiolus japonicus methanotrophic gill symbiont TaxID=113269 RepID=UPI001B738EF7|nr:heme-binding beta-barrel domain-containing protein [Bathymodiolus japonicus methanotrophic gill symbiont]GFO72697.1 hypothetical protein BJAS_P3145 [Bathymodiolus japonicus methanotrophic gill symbiont]
MSELTEEDYGPLQGLIGVWRGDKGLDIAPDPEGSENNPYYETISYSACGNVTNAESQVLAAIYYRQIVKRKSNDGIFHDQTGYWMWDAARQLVIHALTIPRAVCVLAGGRYTESMTSAGDVIINVTAHIDDPDWSIIQAPVMQENAKTTDFSLSMTLGNGKLSYAQTTMVDIYGKAFEHTDQNELLLSS